MANKILISLIFIILFLNLFFLAQVQAQEQTNISSTNILNKTTTFLEKKINIPPYLEVTARIILGINSWEQVETQVLMVMLIIWLCVLTLVYMTLQFLPFFNTGFQRFLVALIITCLIGLTEAIKQVALFLFWILDFGFLQRTGILKFILAIIIIGIFVFGAGIILNKFLARAKLEEAEIHGIKAGSTVRLLEQWGKIFGS